MAQVINTNSLSLMTQNNLNASQSSLNTAIQRLSSGLRINSAKDDAAGQAIANRFTANIRGLTQAQRNANDGISLAQTTEGALTEVNNNLQRIRELSVQAANGSNSSSDLQSIQDEIAQRLSEIDRTSSQTDFNGVKVLSGSAKPLTIQVGANDGETISVNLSEISSKTLGLTSFNVTGGVNVANKAATLTDVVGAGGTAAGSVYTVTTTNKNATADDVFKQLADGNTVAVNDGTTTTTYKYNAASGSFSYDKPVAAGNIATEAGNLKPSTGTITGKANIGPGAAVEFEVDATGAVTIGGQKAYIEGGALTTNHVAAGAQATLDDVMTAVADQTTAGSTLEIAGRVYKQDTGAGDLKYEATASKSDVITAMKAVAGTTTNVTLGSGVTSGTVALDDTATSAATYINGKGQLTTTASFTNKYNVDPVDGKVTVVAGGTDPDEADKVGKQVYIDSKGGLSTETTSVGAATADPLAVLDKALSTVDKLRSALGAVQNRLDSTISNLGTTITNLSSSRSRIQDADYATEVSNMTRANILQQAGTSVLAQANQSTQNVLSLLR